MSFLDILKAAEPYVKTGGEIAAKAAQQRGAGRAAEGEAGQAQDRNAIARYIAEQNARNQALLLTENATKDRADRFLTASKTRAQQVGLGDLLANIQDVHLSGLPSYIPHMAFSGGLRPSVLGPNARLAGQNLSRQALEAQMSGSDVPNLPDVSGLGGDAPDLTALPQAGKLDTLLNILGYAGLGAGAYEQVQKQRHPVLAPEAGVPRYDTSAGVGTNVPLSALDDPRLVRNPTRIALLNRAAASGGGYTGD